MSDELKQRAKDFALDGYCKRYINDAHDYSCNDLKDVEELAYIAGAITERKKVIEEIRKTIESYPKSSLVSVGVMYPRYSIELSDLEKVLTKLQQEGE